MSDLKIEKGVPIPGRRSYGSFTATLRKMEVGDSIFVEGMRGQDVGGRFQHVKPMKFAKRDAEGGVRIWRIE